MIDMLVIATGGTIEKLSDWETRDKSGLSMFPKKSKTPDILHILGIRDFSFCEMKLVDSIYMDDDYRFQIVKKVIESQESEIIITHGTDTMLQTASFLAGALRFLNISNKRIIITGAMVPFSKGLKSDATANLSRAVRTLSKVPSGIYICMNDLVLPHGNARKEYEKELFVLVNSAGESY